MMNRPQRRMGIALSAVFALLPVSAATADHADAVIGRFDVTYAQVTSNCSSNEMELTASSLVVTQRKANEIEVTLNVPNIPMMLGSARKGGRLKAASRLTAMRGLEGKFSIAGTIKSDGSLDSTLFVAEYYDHGKAQCTQTWSVSGTRSVAPPKK